MPGGVRGASWPAVGRALVLGLVLVVVSAGCTYSSQEPGLFGHNQPSAPQSSGLSDAERVNPDLPVLGERTLTPDRNDDPPLRVALHAIRRTKGGTLLDWSITPLQQVGLRVGQAVDDHSTAATLADAAPSFRIIDSDHHKVYDPLVSTRTNGCLCSVPAGDLRIGVTSLLQVAFPPLPSTLHSVSVELPAVELFTDVPVPERGSYFGPTRPVDLARSPDVDEVIRWSPSFDYPAAGGQEFRIGIIAIDAASDATSIVWSIWSISEGGGLYATGAPPITARWDRLAHRSTASGLQLAVPGSDADPIGVWYESTGKGGNRDATCLCTDLRSATIDLTRARRSVTVISNLPPLPLRTQFVDVILPGVGRMEHIPVSEALDASSQVAGPIADRSSTVDAPYGRWQAPSGNTWPAPRPTTAAFRHVRTIVNRLA